MIEELKPCPFCGSSDVTIGTNYRGENAASYYAFCRTCKADTRGFPSKETTLNEWNTRAYEAEIEALKETSLKLNAYTGRLGYENSSVKYQLSVALDTLQLIADLEEKGGSIKSEIAANCIEEIQTMAKNS